MLKYKIDVLQSLKDKGYSTHRLRKEKIVSESTIQRLRHNEPVAWAILDKLCELLECQPADLIEFEK